jgi:REP element-mobilizing transposase RayT
MPRVPRKLSKLNLYHVILRGIDKRNIFLSTEDYEKFLYYIIKAKESCNFSLYSYCLMTNHVHLLVKTEEVELGDIIKRIAVGYVQYHNNKYGRTGHLFQNRFKSEPVEDERYLLSVMRYIHQNPIKAGIADKISDYPWSSYHVFCGNNPLKIINTDFVINEFSTIGRFIEFILEGSEESGMEYDTNNKYTDEELYKIISNKANLDSLHSADRTIRNIEIKKIRDLTHASNRQLSRVLGIGRGILNMAK